MANYKKSSKKSSKRSKRFGNRKAKLSKKLASIKRRFTTKKYQHKPLGNKFMQDLTRSMYHDINLNPDIRNNSYIM